MSAIRALLSAWDARIVDDRREQRARAMDGSRDTGLSDSIRMIQKMRDEVRHALARDNMRASQGSASQSPAVAALRAIAVQGVEGCPTAHHCADLAKAALRAMGYE